jgi:phage terminase large subunit-like protein
MCQTNIIAFPYAEVREEKTIGEEACQDLKKLALMSGCIIRCMLNEYGKETRVVFPYLKVRETENWISIASQI